MQPRNPILEVQDLCVTFRTRGEKIDAVRGISFAVFDGEAVGIVGESGSGKTAAVEAIHCLTTGTVSGTIFLNGKKIESPNPRIGMVFQDPMTFLNPTVKIKDQISEGLIYHRLASRKEAQQKAIELLGLVEIPEPALRANQYPHQLSGGMRQRVLIAIALACNPTLLIADEPTTALDAVTQAHILDLLQRMKNRFQMSFLIVSHNFDVIAALCDRILVMYQGTIVESGETRQVMTSPSHPYTRMLLSALPRLDQPRSNLFTATGPISC